MKISSPIPNTSSFKRGSALLIVLGMTAFMVISAVAFSAYMRYSRLPSSYLRRTSSSRHLAKAAIAEAIDLIDISIGNDAYPGQGDGGAAYAYPRSDNENTSAYRIRRNYWRNHCFIGSNRLVNADSTVSTLSMEALAYLPPALINEARYYSRHSTAGQWRNLGFDSGRYAFTAIDVSDHFDINRIAANVGRNSSDNGKVSLAYVFENSNHDGYKTNPSAWDQFMDNFVDAANAYKFGGSMRAPGSAPNPSKLPLVSLADLNLAIGYGNSTWGCPQTVVSPFCRFINTQGSTDFVTSNSGDDSNLMRQMAFVTDSYFPRASSGGEEDDLDLNDPENQPFRASDLRQTTTAMMSALNYSSTGVTRLYESICGLGMCALWDYLDEDNVPISLAIPTIERVPMISAIQAQLGNSQLRMSAPENLDGGNPDGVRVINETTASRTVARTYAYKLDQQMFTTGIMGGKLDTLVTFPFRRDDDVNDTFKVGGRIALFFADSSMKFHTGNANDVLHLGADANIQQATVNNGVFYIPLQEQSLNFSNIETEENAVRQVSFSFGQAAGQIASWLNANPMFKVTKQWTQHPDPEYQGQGTPPWIPQEPDDTATIEDPTECLIPPLLASGTVDTDYSNSGNFKGMVRSGNGKNVKLQMCVWLYVKNSNGKYVDLVPACMKDDDDLNSGRNFQLMGPDGNTIGGTPYPLMRFSGAAFNYNPISVATDLGNGMDFGFGSSAVMCADPRWNWAPEHWFVMPGGLSPQNWLDNCQRGRDGRDRDIFMATSDSTYLQSVYELAFLPRLTSLQDHGNNKIRGDMVSPDNGATDFAQNFADTPNNGFAWRTYRPFATAGYQRDDFDGVGFTSEGTGFRVNPFTESTSVMLAALANTPYNWMVASTNTTGQNALQDSERKAENFNRRYCFNENAPASSRFKWENLERIAKRLKSAMRRQDGDWKQGFDNLDWAGSNNEEMFAGELLADSTCDLYDIDRKFLYGYWRDCFAAKQQLFLIFVRAEPMMMGGGAIGQSPPQLGARAVALVWRDPRKTQADVGGDQPRPHRTRILFYRQFD